MTYTLANHKHTYTKENPDLCYFCGLLKTTIEAIEPVKTQKTNKWTDKWKCPHCSRIIKNDYAKTLQEIKEKVEKSEGKIIVSTGKDTPDGEVFIKVSDIINILEVEI